MITISGKGNCETCHWLRWKLMEEDNVCVAPDRESDAPYREWNKDNDCGVWEPINCKCCDTELVYCGWHVCPNGCITPLPGLKKEEE